MSTRALNVLLNEEMTVLERARALRASLNESHRVEEGDIGYYLGRAFWNRRDPSGKFTHGVGASPKQGVKIGRKEIPGEIQMSGLRVPDASVPKPSIKITMSPDKRARLDALERDLANAATDDERTSIKDKILNTWSGKGEENSVALHPQARKMLWSMYERERAGENRSERDRAANEPLAIKDRGGIATRKADDLEAQLAGMPADDPDRVAVERELAKQQRIARRSENKLAAQQEPAPEAVASVASQNASVQQQIDLINNKIARYKDFVDKNDRAIAELDPSNDKYAERKTRLENTNARHERTIRSAESERESLSRELVDVQGGSGASSIPRDLSPEARDRENQRRVNTDLARVTGSAPFQDERGTLISRAAPEPTGSEIDAARQAASTKAAQMRREGIPASVGSGRNKTVMSRVGGSAQHEQETQARLQIAQQVILRKEALWAGWRELRPDYEDAYAEADARVQLAELAGDENEIAAAEKNLFQVVADFIEALNAKVAESVPGGIGVDSEQIAAYANGADPRITKIMRDPFYLEKQTPWHKAGWRIYANKELEGDLSPDELIRREAATADRWTRLHQDAPGWRLIPAELVKQHEEEPALIGAYGSLNTRIGDWYLDTPSSSVYASWKDPLTMGRPDTPRERVQSLKNWVDLEARVASNREASALKDARDRFNLTQKIAERRSMALLDPELYGTYEFLSKTNELIKERDAIPVWSEDDLSVRAIFAEEISRAADEALKIAARDDDSLADGSGRDAIEKAFADANNRAEARIGDVRPSAELAARNWARQSREAFRRIDKSITEWTSPEMLDKGTPQGLATPELLRTEFAQSSVAGAPRSKGTMTINAGPSRATSTLKKIQALGRQLNPEAPPARTDDDQVEIEKGVKRLVADGRDEATARDRMERLVDRRRIRKIQKQQQTLARELADENIDKAFQLRRLLRDEMGFLSERRSDPDFPVDKREELAAAWWTNQSALAAMDRALRGAGGRIYNNTQDATDALDQAKAHLASANYRIMQLGSKKSPNRPEIDRMIKIRAEYLAQVRAIENDLNIAGMEPAKPAQGQSGEAVLQRRGSKFDLFQVADPIFKDLIATGMPPKEARNSAIRAARKFIRQFKDENGDVPIPSRRPRADVPEPQMPAGQLSLDQAIKRAAGDVRPAPTESTVPLNAAVESISSAVAQRIRDLRLGARPASERLARMLVAAEVAKRVESGEIRRELVAKTMTGEEFTRKERIIQKAVPSKGIEELITYDVSSTPVRKSSQTQIERVAPISTATQDAILLAVLGRVDELKARRSK